jgi:hypothetical protein
VPITCHISLSLSDAAVLNALKIGWVSFGVTAMATAFGENKLMPSNPDCECVVINGRNGHLRANSSWILGRLVRDFESWRGPEIEAKLSQMLQEKRDKLQKKAPTGQVVPMPLRAGLCVSVYSASSKREAGVPDRDHVYYSGLIVAIFQLAVAAIPFGIYGDWGVLMITAAGIILAFATGSLPQWKREKWACRKKNKTVILSRGNGTQHAIVIKGHNNALDLEDLATGQKNIDASASRSTRFAFMTLAILWVFLLITAASVTANTWFLLAVGGIGILQNLAAAGLARNPSAFGIHLEFIDVIGHVKVMATLFEVERKFPHVGLSMLDVFFTGQRTDAEQKEWADLAASVEERNAVQSAHS